MEMSVKKGLLVVVSGPAGSGKGTVNHILQNYPNYAFSVSATTRAPRPGEVDGVNYHYISVEEFKNRIQNGDLLEYTEYCGNFYGTLKKETEAVLESGKNLILEIEVEGAMNIKRLCPDSAVLIMLLPPTYAVQEQRLRGRGTETEEVILRRLERTKEEMEYLPEYDYVVYNYDGCAEACAQEIAGIVRAEQNAMRRNPNAKSKFFGIAE